MLRILSILMGLVLSQQGLAATAAAPSAKSKVEAVKPHHEPNHEPMNVEPEVNAAVSNVPKAKWLAPEAAEANVINEKSAMPAKVRIGLRLTPFNKVITRNRDGTVDTRYVPGEALRHTLRARLNKVNHFFVGDWHIESVPLKWIQKTRRYEVRLNVYRRYGAFGQLEESAGTMDLSGVLEEQQDNVHVLLGVARKRMRDSMGQPLVDVVAGFGPGTVPPKGPSISKNEPSPATAPAVAPATFDGELIRGRF